MVFLIMTVRTMTMPSEPIKYPYRPGEGWAFMQWTDIPSSIDPTNVYLRRLRIILTPRFGLYLHFIIEPDTGVPDPHDHPWVFRTFVLRGGYIEHVYPCGSLYGDVHSWRKMAWERFSYHKFRLDWAHRIVKLQPGTVTLVLTGRKCRKCREWGLHTKHGFVLHKDYFAVQRAFAASNDSFDS